MDGWWISDMASFLSQEEATYNIEALENAELLLLTKPAMDEMIDRIPDMERYFRLLMQNSIIALQRRIRVTQTYSAEETYLKLMEIQPEIISRAPQQHVASYLGITPETLSRIRRQVSTKK
jgi:CRP-like cAMP-binding protein